MESKEAIYFMSYIINGEYGDESLYVGNPQGELMHFYEWVARIEKSINKEKGGEIAILNIKIIKY